MDGLSIAGERIAREADEKTGFLDLGRLGLSELPRELFGLHGLLRLNLGAWYLDNEARRRSAASQLEHNAIAAQIEQLSRLTALQYLSLSETDLSDLTPLKHLRGLQSLDCSETQVSDLTPLKGLPGLQSLSCWGTQVSDLTPLKDLPSLQWLNCFGTQVSDLTPLKDLPGLQSLYCGNTQVSDLTSLKDLPGLQSLDCSETQVSDLTPLKDLPSLQSLDCERTQVSDLTPLKNLPSLQSLDCGGTQVSDLTPLKDLPGLQSLDCSLTQVSDLTPLRNLPSLQWLYCLGTQVSDLTPLKGLASLQSLDCTHAQVSDLTPLRDLPRLQWFYCQGTQVSDLTPLKDLPSLQSLDCDGTQVSDLTPLKDLPSLESLNCSRCRLDSIPEGFWFKPCLTELTLHEARLPGIPTEVLSQRPGDNCLAALRAHLRDLEAGREPMADVKLMVLGNGRIGKTQMCRRLRSEDYDDKVESTHGILVTSAPLRRSGVDRAQQLQIWDFGGQDIYHGTHALFMRSRAIFALMWIPEAEKTAEHRHGGFVFRNQPLGYWAEYVRQFGSADCPVLVIQARCDTPEDEHVRPPIADEALAAFRFRKVLHYSARLDRGRAALDEALRDAADWLTKEQGIAEIGAGRWRVKRRLEAMRDEDAARGPLERRHRSISQEDFLQLCGEAGGVTSPAHLLSYLHNAGTVFYREDLFGDRIILDQGWALEAIYAVFHREKCSRKLQRQNGRFSRSDLAEWIWDEAGYGVKEQELFLSMMRSCGICFQLRRAAAGRDIETEYIAPDLLPERPDGEIEQKWDPALPIEATEFEYSLLPPALMRAVISRIGDEAGFAADYWRNGVYVYESGTGSKALIEQEMTGPWQGRIRIRTQRGQAALLLEKLEALVEAEQRRIGIASTSAATAARRARPPAEAAIEPKVPAPPLKFVQEPSAQPEYFVSYAWGDNTPDGATRESTVDQMCAAAERRGVTILRDKKALGLGDRISKFMQRIGRGDRIFVVLSDKYLRSPFCMFELSEVWRRCAEEDEAFLKRIRVYTLPGAKIWTPLDRARCAAHWKKESGELEALVKENGIEILGKKDFEHYRLLKKFVHQVGDILEAIADIVQPRSFEEFEKYGLDPPDDPGDGKG